MIREKMYRQVQTFKRQGHSKREIAAALEMDAKTVAKYFHMDEGEFRSYRQQHMYRDKLLESYEKDILEVYEKNEFKRLNMSSVYDYLEERHGSLAGNEQTLRNFISYLIQTDKLRLEERLRAYTKVPELPFGQQMQLDFGQYQCSSGLKLYIFAGVLSASRYKYIAFQGHPFTTKDVIDHLLECFDYFGGMPEELVIDQDRLMVVSENAGDIIYTGDFKYFIEEQEIRMYVCRKDDPETKGKIENLIKYVKCNFLGIRDFAFIDEANSSVLKWLQRRANGKISQATKQIPDILIENERQHLRPVRNSIFRKGSLTGKEIVAYDLSPIPGQLITKREFRRENEKTLQELKDHVVGMFAGENWSRFTALNFKAFPRYIRDQCVEAKRHFGTGDIDIFVLDRALEYCVENNTPSFTDLHDTYVYFEREYGREDLEMPAVISGYQGGHESLRIRARELSVYKDLINARGTLNESL